MRHSYNEVTCGQFNWQCGNVVYIYMCVCIYICSLLNIRMPFIFFCLFFQISQNGMHIQRSLAKCEINANFTQDNCQIELWFRESSESLKLNCGIFPLMNLQKWAWVHLLSQFYEWEWKFATYFNCRQKRVRTKDS